MPGRVLCSLGAVVVAAAAVLAACYPPPSRPCALDTNALGISPVDEPDNFHLTLMPGEAADGKAVVANQTNEPYRVLVYPVDPSLTPSGASRLASRATGSA